MTRRRAAVCALTLAIALAVGVGTAGADGDLGKVKHIVFLMQENRSFDNYFGALPYVQGGTYHPCVDNKRLTDHRCVDGLTCQRDATNELICSNSNLDLNGNVIFAYHNRQICGRTGLDHGWGESHAEANWSNPGRITSSTPNDGFVRENQDGNPDKVAGADAIGFFTEAELPFYYEIAQRFGIDDRYHASVIGPTLPNRLYFMAATSFGHTTTGEAIPPLPDGYRPINGTLLDMMDAANVSWMNYYSDLPASFYLRPFFSTHLAPIAQFASDLAAGKLADVTYIDSNFGILNGAAESDEAPPNNIRRGEYFVAQNVALIRNSQFWKDTIVFITYDEHGGAYDHVSLPRARQRGKHTPDGIAPGQCADRSNWPASQVPGGGANCTESAADAAATCTAFSPTGKYPTSCPSYDRYGFRVPLMAVSPFSKPGYVSHTLADHTSLVALVEKRFLRSPGRVKHPALTDRDARAHTLEDMFDFNTSPSLNAVIPAAPPESPTDENCH